METRQLGSLRARIVGGEEQKGGPTIVLLHGFGAPGTDLVPLHQAFSLPPSVRWIFPEAPLDLSAMGGFGARAWWMIDMQALEHAQRTGEIRDRSDDTPEGLAPARDAMIELLDEVDKEFSPSSLVLGGFSQGAMLSLDVALHWDKALAGLVQLSGTLLSQSVWKDKMKAREGLPVFQSHGQNDPLLPFSIAERLHSLMKESGMQADFVPFRGGHEIPRPVLAELQRFFETTVPT